MERANPSPVLEAWEVIPGDILPTGMVPHRHDSLMKVSEFHILYDSDEVEFIGIDMLSHEHVYMRIPATLQIHVWERV